MKFSEKLSSGKFFATVTIILTYCACILVALLLTYLKIVSPEIFLALFALIGQNTKDIVKDYFNKNQGDSENA